MLWKYMREESSLYLITCRLNQDPLENFFAILRSRSGQNSNPSAMEFRRNLQYAMTANFMKPPIGTNCDIDDTNALLLIIPNQNENQDQNQNKNENENNNDSIIEKNIEMWVHNEDMIRFEQVNLNIEDNYTENEPVFSLTALEDCSIRYVSGYLAHKCFIKFNNCPECLVSLVKNNEILEKTNELLIFWKTYRNNDDDEIGNLRAPSDEFFSVMTLAYKIYDKEFKLHSHKTKIALHLCKCINDALIEKRSKFWVTDSQCSYHRKHIIFFVRLQIFYNLKWISRNYRNKSNNKKRTNNGITPLRKHKKLFNMTHR